jgi:hypothetical protein
VTAKAEFTTFRGRLDRRLVREHRAPLSAEYFKLRALWEAWEREYLVLKDEPMGHVGVRLPPPRWEELEDEYGPPAPSPAAARGRPAGAQPIPSATFWAVVEMALEGKTARQIEKATEDNSLAFVNREKVGEIIKWVEHDKPAAVEAKVAEKIPANFSATPDGVIIQTRKTQ